MKKTNENIYNFLLDNGVLDLPLLNDNAIIQWGHTNENVINHYNSYLQNILISNNCGPIERHPYIDFFENCYNSSYQFLLLGTFPPSTYFNNLDLAASEANVKFIYS